MSPLACGSAGTSSCVATHCAQDGVIGKPVNKIATFEPNVGAHIAPPHAEGNEAKLLGHDSGVRRRLRQNIAKSLPNTTPYLSLQAQRQITTPYQRSLTISQLTDRGRNRSASCASIAGRNSDRRRAPEWRPSVNDGGCAG
jgi:hypothetical protein